MKDDPKDRPKGASQNEPDEDDSAEQMAQAMAEEAALKAAKIAARIKAKPAAKPAAEGAGGEPSGQGDEKASGDTPRDGNEDQAEEAAAEATGGAGEAGVSEADVAATAQMGAELNEQAEPLNEQPLAAQTGDIEADAAEPPEATDPEVIDQEAVDQEAADGEPAAADAGEPMSAYKFDPEAEGPGYAEGEEAAEDEGEEAKEAEEGEGAEEEPAGLVGRLSRLPRRLWAANKWAVGGGVAALCLVVATAAVLLPGRGDRKAEAPVVQAAPVDRSLRLLDPFIFTGKAEGDETIYKIGLAVQFSDPTAARHFDDSMNAARYDIYNFFTSAVEQQPLGAQKAEIQEAVRELLNARLGAGQVVKVYFREFLAV